MKNSIVIFCLAIAGGFVWLVSRGFAIPNAVAICVCGGIVLWGMLILGSDRWIERLQKTLNRNPLFLLLIVGALWGLYLLYAISTNSVSPLALVVMGAYFSVPFLLL